MHKKSSGYTKAGVSLATIVGIAIVAVILIGNSTLPIVEDEPYVESWHTIAVITEKTIVTMAAPGANTSGFISTWCLDYGEDPTVNLLNNATDWSDIANATIHGYNGVDAATEDLKSEDPFYFCVRAQFEYDHCGDNGDFNDDRVRCSLTTVGAEDTDVTEIWADRDNSTGIVSANDTNAGCLFVNFYWDDGDNGYFITDDGSITYTIIVQARY